MKNLFYYRLEEAEKIKDTYKCWIGKEAHIGKGFKEILKDIAIRPWREEQRGKETEKLYKVEFEFETKKKFSAQEFLFHNSLMSKFHHPLQREEKRQSVA